MRASLVSSCERWLAVFFFFFFFFNDRATTEIYTLSLHDALPIWCCAGLAACVTGCAAFWNGGFPPTDRKSTRLNSSHRYLSYAVFCLKKKKKYRFKLNFSLTFSFLPQRLSFISRY